jgi:hypothetical protein
MLGITRTALMTLHDGTGVGPHHDADNGQRRCCPEGRVKAIRQAN